MNLMTFIRTFWPVIEKGTEFVPNWHHKAMCRALELHTFRINAGLSKYDSPNPIAARDVVINVPPRTTKSIVCTVMWPAWAWTINPKISFLTASYSGSLATKHARMSRTLIQSDEYQREFPQAFQILTDQNVKSHYENDQMGSRYAVGFGGSATGSGGDVILIDDPLSPKQANSDIERTNANRDFDETFYNRTKDPNTAVRVIVMQRIHEEDLTGHVLKENRDAWYHICLPAEETVDIKPEGLRKHYENGLLWPGRFDRELLGQYQNALGSYGYSGQYLQRPSPAEGGYLKRQWFKRFTTINPQATVNVYIDTAYTEKEQNDPSALLACYEDGDDIYVVRVEAVRYEFPELMKYVQIFCREVGCTHHSRIAIEPKASGKSLVQVLRKETGLNVVEDANPTRDKVARVKDISAIVEAGRVHLLPGPWMDAFLNECASFPNGLHDDRVDVLVMALNRNKSKFFAI